MCLAHVKLNLDHSLYVWSAVLKDLNTRLEKGEIILKRVAASEQTERTKRNMIFKSKLVNTSAKPSSWCKRKEARIPSHKIYAHNIVIMQLL